MSGQPYSAPLPVSEDWHSYPPKGTTWVLNWLAQYPVVTSEATKHVPGQGGHSRILTVPTVGKTANASDLGAPWHTLTPPNVAPLVTPWTAHIADAPYGTPLGAYPIYKR